MDLADIFPPLGVRVEADALVLRPITDDVLPALIDLALTGIHDPAMMPFLAPWTDSPADRLPGEFARYHWGLRSNWSPQAWSLAFAVEYDDEIVGTQGFSTTDYAVTRVGETGSWLGRAHHGRGIGTLMRQAICAFAFDCLDAVEVTSGSFFDNPASLAVSRKVGYRLNGTRRLSRRGEPAVNQRLTLVAADFVRGPAIAATGVDAFRRFIGLGP